MVCRVKRVGCMHRATQSFGARVADQAFKRSLLFSRLARVLCFRRAEAHTCFVLAGGKYVVNPSGGLISKGHPLGATGLAQCFELCSQLRNECGVRQVKGAKIALQHNLGLGGAAVVSLYRKATFQLPGKVVGPDVSTVGQKPEAPKPAIKGVPFDTPKGAAPAKAAAAPKAAAAVPAGGAGGFQATAVFADLAKRLEADKDIVKKVGVVYRFDLTADGKNKSWLVDLKNGAGAVKECDASAKADCMISMKDSDFLLLMAGKLQAQQAFMKGQLKIKGNMMVPHTHGQN
jgi:sterol carrier protein 2